MCDIVTHRGLQSILTYSPSSYQVLSFDRSCHNKCPCREDVRWQCSQNHGQPASDHGPLPDGSHLARVWGGPQSWPGGTESHRTSPCPPPGVCQPAMKRAYSSEHPSTQTWLNSTFLWGDLLQWKGRLYTHQQLHTLGMQRNALWAYRSAIFCESTCAVNQMCS